jgi:hypothetical protein
VARKYKKDKGFFFKNTHLLYSQIWLTSHMDDHHFGYITKKITQKTYLNLILTRFLFYFLKKTASCQQIMHKFPYIYLKLLQQAEIFYGISEPHVQHTPPVC